MRKYLLAAAAVAAIASPAAARDGSGYLGIEGGVLFPRDQDGNVDVDFTTTQTPATPAGPAGPADFSEDGAFGVDYKRGRDLDIIAGYDFGAFRLEGELGFKRASLDEFDVDQDFINQLNVGLNRPAGAGDVGTLPALAASDFDLGGRVKVRSLMVNALADFGADDGLSFYAGVGAGRARVRAFDDRDSAWAFQLIAGARTAISENIDLGLKYRYFRTGRLQFFNDSVGTVAGNGNAVVVGTTPIVQTTSALVSTDFEERFRSHSLLASLIFNFAAPAAPAPEPMVVAPPPPPAAPATQTCPDGSVILTTEICPAPPPPPPPPPPSAGERG